MRESMFIVPHFRLINFFICSMNMFPRQKALVFTQIIILGSKEKVYTGGKVVGFKK